MCRLKFVSVLVLVMVLEFSTAQPYANDYPYKKYGYKVEGVTSESDGQRLFKNNLRDRDGRLKANADIGSSSYLDANKNEHDLNQVKKGGSTDNLTHVQGEDFETDKTHKRKHIKSGFQNSYHKDENGSRISYYEDSDDTGGRVVYDKRHGQRGDNQESQYNEGLRNGITRDRYDNRKTGFDNRDLQDQSRFRLEDQGKQHGYADNYKGGDEFEIVRRPFSDHYRHSSRLRDVDDYERYQPSNHWGYNSRLPVPPNLHDDIPPARDVYTKRRITIYEDPRDEFVDPKIDRFHDNGNYMTRSEITRRFDYGPSDRTPFRMRYRGL